MGRYAIARCWRLWRRWQASGGYWLVARSPADGSPAYREVTAEQFVRLLRCIRAEFRP